jgi:hypothetical protein
MTDPYLGSGDGTIPSAGESGASPLARTRPRRATTVAVLLMVFGALGVLLAFVLTSILNDATDHGETVSGGFYLLAYASLALSAAEIVSGVFVLMGRSWARMLAIVLCSLNILSGVISLFTGSFTAIVGVLLNIGLIRLLNRDDVRDWCG